MVWKDAGPDHGPPPTYSYYRAALESLAFVQPLTDIAFREPQKWVLPSEGAPRVMRYGWRVPFDGTGFSGFGGRTRSTFAGFFVNNRLVAVYDGSSWTEQL